MKNVTPILKEIKANSHTPQYRMHKYYARRPYNVFPNIIEHYSKENDIILDPFCGGGVTVFESLKLKRNAIGVDLNPLATFITKMQMFINNLIELEDELADWNERIWMLMVESATVHRDSSITFKFQSGVTIKTK